MAKETKVKATKGNPEGGMNRHKAMAMGEKIELKKGGIAKKATGGMACKEGGHIKKRGK